MDISAKNVRSVDEGTVDEFPTFRNDDGKTCSALRLACYRVGHAGEGKGRKSGAAYGDGFVEEGKREKKMEEDEGRPCGLGFDEKGKKIKIKGRGWF